MLLCFAMIFLPPSQALVAQFADPERYGTNNGGLARMFSKNAEDMNSIDSSQNESLDRTILQIRGRSHQSNEFTPIHRNSRAAKSHQEVTYLRKVLRGGNPEAAAITPSAPREDSSLIYATEPMMVNLPVCLSALAIVISTTFAYFVTAVYGFYALEALHGCELSPNTIASISLIASLLGSSVTCGAFLGRIASSHPIRHAAAVGAAFTLLQLWQLALLQGIPVWLTVPALLSFPPCCAYAAKRTAERHAPKVVASAPTAAAAAAAAAPSAAPAAAAAIAVTAAPDDSAQQLPAPSATAPPHTTK
jgi:hypothetical protein